MFGISDDELDGFVDIKASFGDNDITGVFKINSLGDVINTKSREKLKRLTTGHGKDVAPHYCFSYNSCTTECQIDKLVSTYFDHNETGTRLFKIIEEIDGKKLQHSVKVYEDGTIATLITQKKCEQNLKKDLRIYLDPTKCEKVLTPTVPKGGYKTIGLRLESGRQRHINLNLLVMIAFKPKENYKELKLQVHHIDFNTHNNHIDNLQWVTQQLNCLLKECHNDPDCSIKKRTNTRKLKDGSTIPDSYNVTFGFNGDSFTTSFHTIEEARAWRDLSLKLRRDDINISTGELRQKLKLPENKRKTPMRKRYSAPQNDNGIPNLKCGGYVVYIDGSVWSTFSGKYMSPSEDKDGYLQISFRTPLTRLELEQSAWRLHRLIAFFFLPVSEDISTLDVDHIDRDRKNNHVSNLRWVSKKVNQNNKKNNR